MATGRLFGSWTQDKPKKKQEFRPLNGKHDIDKFDNIHTARYLTKYSKQYDAQCSVHIFHVSNIMSVTYWDQLQIIFSENYIT